MKLRIGWLEREVGIPFYKHGTAVERAFCFILDEAYRRIINAYNDKYDLIYRDALVTLFSKHEDFIRNTIRDIANSETPEQLLSHFRDSSIANSSIGLSNFFSDITFSYEEITQLFRVSSDRQQTLIAHLSRIIVPKLKKAVTELIADNNAYELGTINDYDLSNSTSYFLTVVEESIRSIENV